MRPLGDLGLKRRNKAIAPYVLMGAEPVAHKFAGSERAPTLDELKEIQRRLTALGFATGGTGGRVGNDTP